MQSGAGKIKRVPCSTYLFFDILLNVFNSRVAFKHRENAKIRKLGLLHSKNISSLNMDLWGDDFLKEFYKSLQSKPLKKFTYSSFHTSNQEMLLLATLFRRLGYKTLKKLSFLFQETEMAKDCDVKVISKSVRHLSKLTSLDFEIYNFYNVRGTFLAPLQQSLRLLPSLKHLKIHTELCDMWNQAGFQYMLQSLNGLNTQKIQSLYFDLSRVRKDLSEFLPQLMRKVANFTQLKKFGLHLVEDPIQLGGFRESMDVIPKLKNLEEISFSASYPLRDEEYKVFMEATGANPNIKNIYVKLSDLKKSGFEALNKSLGQLNSLEKLKLNLTVPNPPIRYDDDEEEEVQEVVDPTQLDDECLRNLAGNLNRHSKTLKMFSFSLNTFFGDESLARFTSKGYGQIGHGLLGCSNIEDLLLMYLGHLESEDIVKNFQAIQNMKNMKSLVLKIGASGSISADVMTALKEALASIKNVEKLYLLFTDFTELTDKAIKGFLEEIANMHNLVEFCWALSNVPKLTQASLNATVETLKGLKALKTGQLNFVLESPKRMFGKELSLTMPDIEFENKMILIERQDIRFKVNALIHKLNHN